jgi:hypothetical protein
MITFVDDPISRPSNFEPRSVRLSTKTSVEFEIDAVLVHGGAAHAVVTLSSSARSRATSGWAFVTDSRAEV